MIHGLYTAASGMLVQQTALDANANNLANAGTTSYRRQLVSVNSFPRALENAWGAIAPLEGEPSPSRYLATAMMTDTAGGILRQTENPGDLALRGDGFFVIRDAAGREALTRDGSFTLNPDNELATADGWQVLGERGPITIDSATWQVDPSGQVTVDGTVVDRLQIVLPAAGATRIGNTRWAAADTTPAANPRVAQGYLESSNVNTVAEMVALIAATRTFEASQRCVQALDSTLDRAVNEVGRTA
ncbi:MAG: flagellar hook-basal body protein [Armatimonadota bacterium]